MAQITAQAWQGSTRSAFCWQALRRTGLLTSCRRHRPIQFADACSRRCLALGLGCVVDLIGGPIGFRIEEMELVDTGLPIT
ncbi:hypothetical protein IVA80_23960 [Bradyrhizobium sp. 139]|uniref:hypothetical protein n=1 Tax=Bradyrhizobium sp. 139 TaxID=2782616 RepID=UPI001FF79690|nr:hypothetical protein [Bradyrhizobium sp. 139]MCK1743810.1 hypothetical protein [Bradyrhizobium sp. 139]